ncbi:MAG TPA: hypothetical protein VK808_03895 [Bacteroidia bacterium]|nr:hypothetical protein [Bacteroidia bacterium]
MNTKKAILLFAVSIFSIRILAQTAPVGSAVPGFPQAKPNLLPPPDYNPKQDHKPQDTLPHKKNHRQKSDTIQNKQPTHFGPKKDSVQ